ncbi:MAG: RsmB/NOP family class I SAM-dependent RNA methyltransferase [Chlamydiota bacterium]
MSEYFRANKALGSKDRADIGNSAYQLLRWKGLLEAITLKPGNWRVSYELLSSQTIDQLQKNHDLPLHQRHSCPEALFKLLVNHYGKEKACDLCELFNERAPLTIRVNTLKTDRKSLFDRWKGLYDISLSQEASEGIIFGKNLHILGMEEYRKGFFEVQDEGSQLLSNLVKVEPGQQVLDYCAGAGGKSLAIAAKMQQKGQLYLHDIRTNALQEAKRRLRRAGAQNVQIIHSEDTKGLKRLKKRMNWVLVDAPCSGTGTLRRNPDMKWWFNEETLSNLVGQQRLIFEKALSFVRAGGKIVYATCSILPEENQQQVEHFLNTYDLELDSPPLEILPVSGGMDGFFGAVFSVKKKGNNIP